MTFEIALVLGTALALFVLFVRESAPTELLALGAVTVLMVAGILSTNDTLSVFSNPAAMTVASMFVLSAALDKTGVIDVIGKWTVRMADTNALLAVGLVFLAVFVGSFFINNTSVVLIMIPIMITLARHLKTPASKFLIPLSYVSIMGGMCTLIGTSTNLLVDGAVQQMGLPGFGMFDIFVPGMMLAAVGAAYMLIAGRWILPVRQSLSDVFDTKVSRRYLFNIQIAPDSRMAGKMIAECGLVRGAGFEVIQHIHAAEDIRSRSMRMLSRFDVARLLRSKISMTEETDDVDMQAILSPGDRLVVLSNQQNILELESDIVSFKEEEVEKDNAMTMEGIIAPHSSFIGKTVGAINENNPYDIQILAVHRKNGTVSKDFKTVHLSVADTVLIRGEEKDLVRVFNNDEMVNLSKPEHDPYRKTHAPLAIAALVCAIILATAGVMPVAGACFIAAVAVVMAGCLKIEDAYKALQGNVLLLIYAMLAVSIAMENSGALSFVVGGIIGVVKDLPPVVIISVIYLMTSIITEFFSNNAAAVMLTPLAVGLAQGLGLDPVPFAAAIMFGASASFATPVGYQTNTLVFNAGGYEFKDFLKIGVPMNVLMWIAATIIIPLYWGL